MSLLLHQSSIHRMNTSAQGYAGHALSRDVTPLKSYCTDTVPTQCTRIYVPTAQAYRLRQSMSSRPPAGPTQSAEAHRPHTVTRSFCLSLQLLMVAGEVLLRPLASELRHACFVALPLGRRIPLPTAKCLKTSGCGKGRLPQQVMPGPLNLSLPLSETAGVVNQMLLRLSHLNALQEMYTRRPLRPTYMQLASSQAPCLLVTQQLRHWIAPQQKPYLV